MLGEALRRLREDRGLSMARLARLSDISRAHLYSIEGGHNERPRVETLIKLSRGLASWRSDEPDEAEWADAFKQLEDAAGYGVGEPSAGGEVPDQLQARFRAIAANWPHLQVSEREHVVQLLSLLSSYGRPSGHTLSTFVNGSPIKSTANYNYTEHRKPGFRPLAPVRELALAGH